MMGQGRTGGGDNKGNQFCLRNKKSIHMEKPMVLFLVLALLSGCATSPMGQTTPTPQSIASPSPSTQTTTSTALALPPNVRADEKWIEVDLGAQKVRLWEGSQIVAEYLAASGVATTPETTTVPGEYRVQQMIPGPIENAPSVFVSDILIYDIAAGAGIHSMPMDKEGNILDIRMGEPVTAGCVRVREANAVFRFARLGMRIWIH